MRNYLVTSILPAIARPLLAILLLSTLTANAQRNPTADIQRNPMVVSADEVAGPKHELLPIPGGDYLCITYLYDDTRGPLTVSRFDHSLKEKYTHQNMEIEKEHYRSAIQSNDRLFLLCSDKDGAVNRYEIDQNSGGLSGSPAPVFNLSAKEEDCSFLAGSSKANSWHYLVAQGHVKHEKGQILQGAILDQQCNKVGSFSYTTPEDRDDIDRLDIVQTEKGGLFLIYRVYQKTTKDNYTPYTFTVVTVDPDGKTGSFALTGLPAGDFRNVDWEMVDNRLGFIGFIAPAKKGGVSTICYGTVDPVQKKAADIKTTAIPPLMARVPQHNRGWIYDDATLAHTLPLPDGSRVLMLEVRSGFEHDSHYAAVPGSSNAALANGTMTSYSITYYYRSEIYLLKVSHDNTPQWLNVVTKRQAEADIVLATGTAVRTDANGNIRLFFMDRKENTEAACEKDPVGVNGLEYKKNFLACVTVSADGSMKKQFFDPAQDPEYRPILEKAVPGSDNELCFLTIKLKKAFKEEATLTHSHFRLGTLKLQ